MNRETSEERPSTPLHGEFKTPGGKLVVVDFSLQEGRMCGVQITGDFFLYPEDVLDRLNAALEGASPSDARLNYVAVMNGALNSNDVLVGVSPEAIAVSIKRALGGS